MIVAADCSTFPFPADPSSHAVKLFCVRDALVIEEGAIALEDLLAAGRVVSIEGAIVLLDFATREEHGAVFDAPEIAARLDHPFCRFVCPLARRQPEPAAQDGDPLRTNISIDV